MLICFSLYAISGNFIADENGSNDPLKKYKSKTLVIVLPGDLTVFDVGKNLMLVIGREGQLYYAGPCSVRKRNNSYTNLSKCQFLATRADQVLPTFHNST